MSGRSPLLARLLTLATVPLTLLACEPPQTHGAHTVPQSSRLGMSKDGKTLYVALADHDQVRAMDTNTGALTGVVDVPGYPHRLTVMDDGRVAVTSRYGGTLSVVDVEGGEVDATVEVGADPFAVVELDGALWVAVAGEAELARVDQRDLSRVALRVPLAYQTPRGIAATDDGKLLVSHSFDGKLSVVDASRGELQGDVDMKLPSRGFFSPTQLDAITVSPAGGEVAVPHVECNNDPAQFGAGGTDLAGAAAQYYVEGPTGFPAVVPAVSRVDADNEVLLSDDNSPNTVTTGVATTEPTGPASPIINPLDRTLLEDQLVNGPTAVAFAEDGELELVVNRSSGNVLVRRSHVEPGQSSLIAVVKIGTGADSIQLSRDGSRAFVYNAFDDEVVSFQMPDLARKQTRYSDSAGRGSTEVFSGRSEPLQRLKTEHRFTVAPPMLSDEVLAGRKLFHSVDERLTRLGAVSCASCHPGGSGDGVTWQFAEGPRQSPPLWGGISDSAPFHWDSHVATLADISSVTIQGRMGGTGLSAGEMDKIGAFLDTIPAPAAPRVQDESAVERGRVLFFSDATACTSCHNGDDLSDGALHDVATGAGVTPRETESAFATPNLHGLAQSGPYLHDGSARTLEEMVDRLVRTDLMGKGSHLSDSDAADLVAFLKTL